MIRASVIGLACSAILAASVASMTGCSSAADSAPGTTSAATIRSTNVALTVQDASGAEVGSGSGILIAPKLVLTAAHLVSGQSKWMVKTADGKIAHGSRGVSYDWLVYNNDKAHPRQNDLAVVYLDEAINLPAYPRVASSALGVGASATRVHGQGTIFTNVSSTLGKLSSFPNSYITDMPSGEALDTGGAVLDARNDIIGVVTGRGLTTNKLYIARTDSLSTWVTTESDTCDADGPPPTAPPAPPATTSSTSSSSTSGDIVVKTYTPPSAGDDDDDNYNSSSSSSSGTPANCDSANCTTTTSSSSSSGSSSSSSGSSSSSSGSPPDHCIPSTNTGNCYGDSCGTHSSSSSSSSSGTANCDSADCGSSSSGSSSSGSSTSSSGSSTSSSGGGDDDDDNGGYNPIVPPGSSTSSTGGTSSTSSGGSSSGSTSSGGSSSGNTDSGGDDAIDYGACPGCGNIPPTGGITVK